jgi:hypothetical protein
MDDKIRYPKLRTVDVRPLVQNGQPCVLLRDPLQLSDKTLLIPQPLGLALSVCDGTREDARALSASVTLRYGVHIGPNVIDRLLAALDDALLLDNASYAQARERAIAEYHAAPFRFPIMAGRSFPAETAELRRLLQGYLDSVDETSGSFQYRGLVSPHIDYARGGPVYARVWKRAAEMVQTADLAVILGTDHFGGQDNLLSLTRQNYATPFGVLPTARDIVDALAAAIGKSAFAGELAHRGEHSIELAAVWLHYMRGERPCELAPILCGAFESLPGTPEDNSVIQALLDTFQAAAAGRKVIVIAAGDLAHVGPAFGGQPLDLMERARLKAADSELMEQMCAGNAAGFWQAIQRINGRNNVCGVPPIYLALRLLAPTVGNQVAYAQCPADNTGTSVVSVCGIVFE